MGIAFRGNLETAGLVVGFAGEGFLFAADIDAGGVDFVVAVGLEEVEVLGVVGLGGDAGAGVDVGAVGLRVLGGGE